MADNFQDFLQEPNKEVTDEQIVKEIEADNEKDYYRQLKKKNKEYLINGLTLLERERISQHIVDLFNQVKTKHKELCDKIDEYDDVYRMKRKKVQGADESMPNYRTPLSTVTEEVVHSNIMNVFFTPKDIMRVLPTEEGDIPKVNKLSTFGNWSCKNELDIFNQCDRLFHNSNKVGECPYIVHWVKEYGTEIEREILTDPTDPTRPLFDPDTQEVLYQEVEKQKLLYNGPKLEVFSRKDYRQPLNALMDKLPEWEMRIIRMSYDEYLRDELQGKMYAGSIKEIMGWRGSGVDTNKLDYEGDSIPVGEWNKEFVEFYGKLRIKVLKEDAEDETEEYQELSEEFIAIVNIESNVLCSLRKNKFPLKLRPIGLDYFIPDDDGRRAGTGVMEFMDGPQKCYDGLFNQYLAGTVRSNNPIIFFTPMGNMRNEPIEIQYGYMYPTSDPNSIKVFEFPPPNQHMNLMLELVSYWSQMLFGISDYSAGMESKIDPSAPAKKAQIVVAQGNVRLNTIVKRKNRTLQDIFKRWYLLYKENMPPNKFMRIAGHGENPWKFEAVKLSDFALKSLPDFELTGNILNVNKTYEANKKLAVYNVFIQNPFFQPNTRQGLMGLHALTKWLADGLEETGVLSRMLPEIPGEMVHTPEEENARFLQGDSGKPMQGEDHVNHIRVHRILLVDPSIPDEVKKVVIQHINETVKIMQQEITQQMVLGEMGVNPNQANQKTGAGNAYQRPRTNERATQIPTGETERMVSSPREGMV